VQRHVLDSHMRLRLFSLFTSLVISATILLASRAFGQSLSITRKGETNYWVEAIAPASNPSSLQASGNLHLWVDIHNPVQELYSLQFTNEGVSQRYFRLIPAPPEAPPIRVMLLGDSLVNECCGWGPGLLPYFRANATVLNFAVGGYSTKVFLQSAEKDRMLLIKPEYVLINLGAFDEIAGPTGLNYEGLWTTLDEYADNLRTITGLIRGFNGVPIFVTIHAAQMWDANGNLLPRWQERNARMKQVAAELHAPLIDLNQLTTDLLNQLGESGSAFMHFNAGGPTVDGPTDAVHLSPLGGQYVARLLVNALPDEFGPYLTGIFDPPPKP
jgi:lysophospholipase L1-like esterase